MRVVWNDAQDHNEPWVPVEDAEKFGNEDCQIVSVGFLVSKTSRYVTLAADWNESGGDYGRVTKIPAGMVQSISELRVEES
jgi:hypothetical protein